MQMGSFSMAQRTPVREIFFCKKISFLQVFADVCRLLLKTANQDIFTQYKFNYCLN